MPEPELASSTWRGLADVVLVVHAAVVAFVLGGLVLVWVGNGRGWRWVNGVGFRVVHGLAITVVAAEAWLGIACPLTTLEQAFRAQAGAPALDAGKGFVEHWLGQLLFYDAPAWVFTLAYSVFAVLVFAAGWRYPPRWK